MYCGRDFDPADEGESGIFTFDFVKDVQSRDTITAAVWTCGVAAISEAPDADAADYVDGSASFSGTKTSQRITGMKAGVTYVLSATVTTVAGDTVTLWSHVECRTPA